MIEIGDYVKVNSRSEYYAGKIGKIIGFRKTKVPDKEIVGIFVQHGDKEKNQISLYMFKFDKLSKEEATLFLLEDNK